MDDENMKTRGNLLGIAAVASFVVGTVETADAMVVVFPDTQPGAQLLNLAFFSGLDRLPGAGFDERAFSSFQYLISADAGDVFDRGDHFITNGEDRKVDPSIAADLGNQPDLSQRQFDFSIQHNFVGGRNFTFALSDTNSGDASTLCWGRGCDANADIVAETLGGDRPFTDFNGLQLQVRAQAADTILNPVADVQLTGLFGVDLAPDTVFFNEVVTPSSDPTLFLDSDGRQGQWLMADANDFTLNEWELTGKVTLSRDDDARDDVTALRFKVDLVRDPDLPFGALVPVPGAVWLFLSGLVVLLGSGGWSRKQKQTV